MSIVPIDRRTRKRLATRQAISDAAARLFDAHGFDRVTVDEIAEAADVGRMTVFNHFPRKEDMFFDLDDAAREQVRAVLRQSDPEIGPIETLRLFAHQVVAEQRDYVRFFDASPRFMQTIAESETLKARARAIRDELAAVVQEGLAERAGQDRSDADAQLAANLLLATWGVAFVQAYQTFERNRDEAEAQRILLALIDQGSIGIKAAMAGSPYA
ncbi:TetR family transcriptional regulator [Metarhizobium album]|uniref:TetR family transcriptional regulator n=1 Tax=Metarhizobium album TaxID=2182425 RepID=A0A2U2DJA9_9HYPH|nr:TetR/AcrR family transcriptional regulator [Rhizobium album]PWE53397.1 TetR family transcriptional regulator [Rhizobium album]